jgi:hypothetical protein
MACSSQPVGYYVCLGRIGILSSSPPFESWHDDGCEQISKHIAYEQCCVAVNSQKSTWLPSCVGRQPGMRGGKS